MNAHQTRILIIIAALSILGLLIIQIYWFRQAFDIQQQQLTQQTNLAIRAVGHQLLLYEGDSTSVVPPVEIRDGGGYYLGLAKYFDYDRLPCVLEETFASHNIFGNYFVAVESCDPKDLVLGYEWNAKEQMAMEPCGSRDQTGTCLNLTITFENQTDQLLANMKIWIFSSLTFLLVLCYFAYSLFLMLREKRLATMRKDFINNMTHELKTPISNIGIAIEQLRKWGASMTNEKQQHYTSIISQENKRLEQQVERVLQMAMIEHQKVELVLEKVDLHALIKDIQKSVNLQLEQVETTLSLNLLADHPIVRADKFHLTNVLLNLLDNAQKYSKGRPDICLETKDMEDHVRVSIIDQGIGIHLTDQVHIFEKFYRVPHGNRHQVKGIGLGLSYVKMIIEAHGGRVGVQSKLHHGSQFWFTL